MNVNSSGRCSCCIVTMYAIDNENIFNFKQVLLVRTHIQLTFQF